MSVGIVEALILKLLGKDALNAIKDLVEGTLTLVKIIWGLEYSTEHLTRKLPAPKLEKAAHLLHLQAFDFWVIFIPLNSYRN